MTKLNLSWQILSYATPVAFWPYETCVMTRIVESERDYRNPDPELAEFERALYAMFREAHIDAHPDNKIAFELNYHGQTLFVGFYDNVCSIGLTSQRTWGGECAIYPASKLKKGSGR